MAIYIAIDPGKDKCGVLLADETNYCVLKGYVVSKYSVLDLIYEWNKSYKVDLILLGNGTYSSYWLDKLKISELPSIKLIDEYRTTLRARERYWQLWPPNCFLRWIPKGLILPSENLDAVAALIMMEDYLNKKLSWQKKDSFKTLPEL